jgi:hypothetical protein
MFKNFTIFQDLILLCESNLRPDFRKLCGNLYVLFEWRDTANYREFEHAEYGTIPGFMRNFEFLKRILHAKLMSDSEI